MVQGTISKLNYLCMPINSLCSTYFRDSDLATAFAATVTVRHTISNSFFFSHLAAELAL